MQPRLFLLHSPDLVLKLPHLFLKPRAQLEKRYSMIGLCQGSGLSFCNHGHPRLHLLFIPHLATLLHSQSHTWVTSKHAHQNAWQNRLDYVRDRSHWRVSLLSLALTICTSLMPQICICNTCLHRADTPICILAYVSFVAKVSTHDFLQSCFPLFHLQLARDIRNVFKEWMHSECTKIDALTQVSTQECLEAWRLQLPAWAYALLSFNVSFRPTLVVQFWVSDVMLKAIVATKTGMMASLSTFH